VVSALCWPSYSSSDVTYSTTGNAAAGGLSWNMGTLLPDSSPPWVTLQINGLTYRYSMSKDPDADAQVHVRNEDAVNGGYIFEETDVWDKVPGGTVQKYFRLPYTDASRWGNGEIAVEGDGQVSNPIVTYNYKLDIDDQMMKCAATPLADPSCPGFRQALMDLLNSTEISVDDPFYDEWVQAQLEKELELEEEKDLEQKENSEDDLEERLGGRNTVDAMVDVKQQEAMLASLADVAKIDSYYQVEIQGGEYEETLTLEDTEIPDNRRALRSLASDANHTKMVRSQYDRDQQEN